jgi:hypothetical protein
MTRKPSPLARAVAAYLAALKARDKQALARATRNSRQVGFSKEAWANEMNRQAKGDQELEAFLDAARAKMKADFEASQTYLQNRPWSLGAQLQDMARANGKWWRRLD